MELTAYDKKCVRITEKNGMIFEGIADVCPAEYGLHEFGREEESVSLGRYQIFAGDVRAIELLDGACFCPFYGSEYVPEQVRQLYRDLKHVWCAETCAPRMREDWSSENPTLGQCSITSFLVQDLFGGTVYGVPLKDGGFHCWNKVGDYEFDLTSEQFGDEELDYDSSVEQTRETHFADADKKERYELLKTRLAEYRTEANHSVFEENDLKNE